MAESSAQAPESPSLGFSRIGGKPVTSMAWILAAFVVAFALAMVALLMFGVGERGTAIALRATARWSFLLFWFAYAGGALAWLSRSRFDGLARRGRELGLAFASATDSRWARPLDHSHRKATRRRHAVLLGRNTLHLSPRLFSISRLRDALGPRLWAIFRTIALEYIAIVFAADFIVAPRQADGLSSYPLTYLPFALVLISGAGLRIVAFSDRKLQHLHENRPLRIRGPSRVSRFGETSREDHLIVWPALIFVGVIVVLLALGHPPCQLFDSALALYGPLVVTEIDKLHPG
jgi:hypothetical protein